MSQTVQLSATGAERLAEARALPSYRRAFNRAAAYGLVYFVRAVAAVARSVRRTPAREAVAAPVRIVLVGGFAADNWIAAHVKPLAASGTFAEVYVVADRAFAPIPRVVYACPPVWLVRIAGNAGARALWFAVVAWRRRAGFLGGFHLLANGLLALATARALGRRAIYFSVGGPAEVVGGGAYSSAAVFGGIGADDKRLEAALLRTVADFDLVVTMGTKARSFFEAHGARRVAVIPGGIDAAAFAPSPATPAKDIDLVLVGRLVTVKRVDVFLHAVARVAARRPDVRAVVIGDGPRRGELESAVRALGIGERVHFAGHQRDVAAWLARARVFALTSDSEGVPLAAMEAMSMGLPVVASNVGDIADVVADGDNGFLVEAGDVTGFARRFEELLASPERLARMSACALSRARAFQLEAAGAMWREVLPCVP